MQAHCHAVHLLPHSIAAAQKQSLARGITPVLSPCFPDNPAQALGSTGGIPDLPTDGCHLIFRQVGLADDIAQTASIHVLHHQPEFIIHKVAERRKQGHGNERAWLHYCLEKTTTDSCFSVPLKRGQTQRNRRSL